MKPKQLFTIILSMVFSIACFATTPSGKADPKSSSVYVNEELSRIFKSNLQAFVKITPKEYQKLTGKELSFKEVVKLKAAQKAVKAELKKEDDGLTKGLYVLLAILGLAWIAMGVKDDWKGNAWVVNLLLTVLCWLPGFIHALVKMKDYYKE
jgi:uncharacterized membrane protein YqaE (UPF0057 family)